MDLRTLATRYLLQNAVLHGGKADAKSTMGRALGSNAELRAHAKEFSALLMELEAEINALSPAEQQSRLDAEAPELTNVVKREKKTGLKELKNVGDKVVLRFAPNPNGPLSFGHGRGVSILAQYAKDYDADIILRLDDTDAQVKPALLDEKRGWNGYQMVEEDFTWLAGRAPTRVVKASDRLEAYYEHARLLIRAGGAYVCTLSPDDWYATKNAGEASPTRENSPDWQLEQFEMMLDGRYKHGEAVLRVKTDMQHKDPALRDWVAFRIIAAEAIHPREKLGEIPRYDCWPLLDFQSAIEDHLQGVTHIIRGKDLMDSTRKQQFLYNHLGWEYPTTTYWGRVSLHEFGKFSTSGMRKAIEAGKYEGWDDVRLPTIRALRRRGYTAAAIRNFWFGLGISEKDIAASIQNVEAESAKVIDPASERRNFVLYPVELALSGVGDVIAHPLRHPSQPKLGARTLVPGGNVLISKADLAPKLRLKDLGNVEIIGNKATFVGTELDRSIPIIQWLPSPAVPFTVIRSGDIPDDAPDDFIPELIRDVGKVESDVPKAIGQIFQFERYGFVKVESADHGVWLHS